MTNFEILKQFYSNFQSLNASGMVDCYADDIIFEDPAFGVLKGERAKNMWRMLVESQQGKDFVVTFSDITETSAKWEAKYTFSQTGRKVHNKIQGQFEFENGKIIKHTDDFNLHAWAKQALGFKGWLLGGTVFFKKKLQAQTNRLLDKWEQKTG